MKAHLMFQDRDFDAKAALARSAQALTQDLGLDALFDAMAQGDEFLQDVARHAVLTSLADPGQIAYRQRVLEDSLAHPDIARDMYALAVDAIERERRIWGWTLDRHPESVLRRSLDVLRLFVEILRKLKRIAEERAEEVRSEGFTGLFAMLRTELGEEYLGEVEHHLSRLELRRGMVLGAKLGEGNKAAGYDLRKSSESRGGLLQRIQTWVGQIGSDERSSHAFEIDPRDEAGHQALGDIRSRGLAVVAMRVGDAADHTLGFFRMLRAELAFYVGCLNLRDRLAGKGEGVSIPHTAPAADEALAGRGLYDIALALSMDGRVVANDFSADGKRLIMITGANRGGKTTFHRSLGQAQLMMQCGLFVPAAFFRASLCAGVFTHYKREEDAGMRTGKLEEELNRMSAVVDELRPGSLMLFNESFASTNEREGSEIARQIVQALLDSDVRVAYVTHLYDLAHGLHRARMGTALFLRAERLADGRRTFRVLEGEPLPTSYGPDLYSRIFSAPQSDAPSSGGRPMQREVRPQAG